MPRNTLIQCRNGTYAAWDAQSSGILANGEPGYITDFNKLKIGDGSTQWGDLTAVNDNITTIVINKTASTIPKMSVVYINGAQGDLPSVQLSIADGESSSSKTYGITTGDIAPNGVGQIVVNGSLKNLDTFSQFDGVTPGTVLWLSPTVSGGITINKPYAPNHTVSLGNLVRVHQQQGVIKVNIQNGFELQELHNVAVTGATNGQFLQYNSGSGLWVPSSSGNFSSLSVNNNPVWHSGNFNTSNIVRTTGVQTITGNKTFSNTTTTLFEDGSYVSYGMSTPEYAVDILTDSFPWVFRARDLGNGTEFSVGNLTNLDNDITISTIDDIHINYNAILFNGESLFQAAIGVGSNGQLLIGNGGSFTKSTLTAGTGISITNGSGTITINSSLNNPVTGTGVANHIAYWNSSSGIVADSGQLYWDSTNDRLGIGTTSPSLKLNVNPASDSNNGIQILNNSAGTSARSLLSISNGSYNAEISLGGTGFTNNGFYRANRLLISGPFITDYVTGQHVFHIGGGGSYQAVSGSTQVGLWDATSLKVTNGIAGGNSAGSSLSLKSTDGVGTTDHIKLLVGNNGATEAMRIINNGNVGIGTATPGYKLQVSGSFGATTKSFRIDHPSKPGWSLEYGSLESPYHGVRLTGRDKVVKGVGTVQLPDYLKDLIHDDESITIQLTNYKHGKTLYVSNIDLQNDQFIVKADRAKSLGELEFFWTLTGVRKDVEDLVVEKRN